MIILVAFEFGLLVLEETNRCIDEDALLFAQDDHELKTSLRTFAWVQSQMSLSNVPSETEPEGNNIILVGRRQLLP